MLSCSNEASFTPKSVTTEQSLTQYALTITASMFPLVSSDITATIAIKNIHTWDLYWTHREATPTTQVTEEDALHNSSVTHTSQKLTFNTAEQPSYDDVLWWYFSVRGGSLDVCRQSLYHGDVSAAAVAKPTPSQSAPSELVHVAKALCATDMNINQTLIQAFVSCYLDYCNSLALFRSQSTQNAAACSIQWGNK